MKRLSFLSALFGFGLNAQLPQSSENLTRTVWSDRKPKPNQPNQCPVCGTMAEPLKRQTCGRLGIPTPCNPPTPKDASYACFKWDEMSCGPDERIVRCKRCNAAFWQDAEPRPE